MPYIKWTKIFIITILKSRYSFNIKNLLILNRALHEILAENKLEHKVLSPKVIGGRKVDSAQVKFICLRTFVNPKSSPDAITPAAINGIIDII